MFITLVYHGCILFVVLFGLARVRKLLIKNDNKMIADIAYKAEIQTFDLFKNYFLVENESYISRNCNSKKGKSYLEQAVIWKQGLGWVEERFNPKYRVEREFQEELNKINKLIINSMSFPSLKDNKGLKDALSDCQREVNQISLSLKEIKSISEIRDRIITLHDDVHKICLFLKNSDIPNKNSNVFSGKNYYQILDVEDDATSDTIKTSYRNLVSKNHPDKYEHLADDLKEIAAEKFKKINEAYEVLKDPNKRKQYNKEIQKGELWLFQ